MLRSRPHRIRPLSRRAWAEAIVLAALTGVAIGGYGEMTRSLPQPGMDQGVVSVPAVTGSPTPNTPELRRDLTDTTARITRDSPATSSSERSTSARRVIPAGEPTESVTTPSRSAEPTEPVEPTTPPAESPTPPTTPSPTSSPTLSPTPSPTLSPAPTPTTPMPKGRDH
jgi:hypothetical protein